MDANDKSVIKTNISRIVASLLTKDDKLPPDAINLDSNIRDILNIDSLSLIDKVMSLEEYFEVDILDLEIDSLLTINMITDVILQKVPEEKLPNLQNEKDIVDALYKLQHDEKDHTGRQIKHILNSTYYSDIQKNLGMPVNNVYILLKKLLKNNKIRHASTLPKWDAGGNLEMVYILFLTKKQLYYIGLKPKLLQFREITLNDLSLDTIFHFDDKGNIEKMDVSCTANDYDKDGLPKKYEYSVSPQFIDVTVQLISKINEYKEVTDDN